MKNDSTSPVVSPELERIARENFWRLFHSVWGNAAAGTYDKALWMKLQSSALSINPEPLGITSTQPKQFTETLPQFASPSAQNIGAVGPSQPAVPNIDTTQRLEAMRAALEKCKAVIPCLIVSNWPPGFEAKREALRLINEALGVPSPEPVASTKGEAGRASAEGETQSSPEPRGEPQLVEGLKRLGKGGEIGD